MKCPFLEEVVVRYCKAYPIRKSIPSSVCDSVSLCLGNKYVECSQYEDVTGIKKHNSKEVNHMSVTNDDQVAEMKQAPGKERPCVWAKLGVVSYRLCTLNYKCDECAFNKKRTKSVRGQAGIIIWQW